MATPEKIHKAAQIMGKHGASKGGKARMLAMTPEAREEAARHAALHRWGGKGEGKRHLATEQKVLQATHGSLDRPLRIGDIEISCYVLENGQRVISQNGMLAALHVSSTPTRGRAIGQLTRFTASKSLQPFVSNHIVSMSNSPVLFKTRGKLAYGYDATLLVELCEVVLAARDAGVLTKQQERIAIRCDILIRGMARVGIIALVDEATGYQEERDRDALYKYLARYISPELMNWTKKFPPEYFHQLRRIYGWPDGGTAPSKGPRYMGKIINLMIYERLPPGILNEIQHKNPVMENGRRANKNYNFLTADVGDPHLNHLVNGSIAIMRGAIDKEMFWEIYNRSFPMPDSFSGEPAIHDELFATKEDE